MRMSTSLQRVFLRRIASVVSGLLGFWLLANAVGVHIEGLRTGHLEYTQNTAIFVIISIVLVIIGGALLFAAWRLWRMPEQLR